MLAGARLRAMIADLKKAGLDNDTIARRAKIARSSLYRFAQGDSRPLLEAYDAIVRLHEQVMQPPGASR
jgi:hypothetical protein